MASERGTSSSTTRRQPSCAATWCWFDDWSMLRTRTSGGAPARQNGMSKRPIDTAVMRHIVHSMASGTSSEVRVFTIEEANALVPTLSRLVGEQLDLGERIQRSV